MLGFSLTKIIFTIAVVFAVWQGFKYFTRLSEQRDKRAKMQTRDPQPPADGVEDMVKCSACGAYTTRGSKSCGRDDCPFRGS